MSEFFFSYQIFPLHNLLCTIILLHGGQDEARYQDFFSSIKISLSIFSMISTSKNVDDLNHINVEMRSSKKNMSKRLWTETRQIEAIDSIQKSSKT